MCVITLIDVDSIYNSILKHANQISTPEQARYIVSAKKRKKFLHVIFKTPGEGNPTSILQ